MGSTPWGRLNIFLMHCICADNYMLDKMNIIENVAKWSKERLDAELEKGYNDMLKGRVTPWNEIYAKLSEAISEIKNGAPVADAEEFIKGLMDS